MTGYTTRDVAELLGLSPARVRAFARAGFLEGSRGPRGEYRFSFQDIVLLRTAKELSDARISPHRIWRALRSLRSQLPTGQPLAALRIAAEGDRIVVRERKSAWHPESGQATFDFQVSQLAEQAAPLVHKAATNVRREESASSDDWFNLGVDFEIVAATAEAKEAYRRATDLDGKNAEAHVNLGRLLHAEGQIATAESHYRQAASAAPDNVTAAFNLGVALEDLGESRDAIAAYESALELDPEFADAHYNLARLYEQTGDKPAAIRHLARYKALTQ